MKLSREAPRTAKKRPAKKAGLSLDGSEPKKFDAAAWKAEKNLRYLRLLLSKVEPDNLYELLHPAEGVNSKSPVYNASKKYVCCEIFFFGSCFIGVWVDTQPRSYTVCPPRGSAKEHGICPIGVVLSSACLYVQRNRVGEQATETYHVLCLWLCKYVEFPNFQLYIYV